MNNTTTKQPKIPGYIPWALLAGSLLCNIYSNNSNSEEAHEPRNHEPKTHEQQTVVEPDNGKLSRYSIPIPLDTKLQCDKVNMAFSIGSTSVPMESFDSPESTIESHIKCQSTQGAFSPIIIKNTMQIDNASDAVLIPKLVEFYRENEYTFDVFEGKQTIEKCSTGHCLVFDLPDEAFIKSKLDPAQLSVFYSYVINDSLELINKDVAKNKNNQKTWDIYKQ